MECASFYFHEEFLLLVRSLRQSAAVRLTWKYDKVPIPKGTNPKTVCLARICILSGNTLFREAEAWWMSDPPCFIGVAGYLILESNFFQ